MNKLLIICGPTATGKTDLAFFLAKKFQGEIISADSRQVYRGMDVGTGKDLPVNSKLEINNNQLTVGYRLKNGIPVWLVDIADPDYVFNAGEYQKLARGVIYDIWSRNKLAIAVGGSGLYIKSIIEPLVLMQVPPNPKLRQLLDKLTREELAAYLKKINPERWNLMNHSDRLNPRRLMRAIEIIDQMKNLKIKMQNDKSKFNKENLLLLGLATSNMFLYKQIDQRVRERVNAGMEEEIRKLLQSGYTWKNSVLGTTIGYKQWKDFFEGLKTKKEIIREWQYAEHGYARRQMIWFKKQKKIIWFDTRKKDSLQKIEKMVGKWYTSNCL